MQKQNFDKVTLQTKGQRNKSPHIAGNKVNNQHTTNKTINDRSLLNKSVAKRQAKEDDLQIKRWEAAIQTNPNNEGAGNKWTEDH